MYITNIYIIFQPQKERPPGGGLSISLSGEEMD
jgi:hypothetical protein